MLGMIP
jgi:hypothetical protein